MIANKETGEVDVTVTRRDAEGNDLPEKTYVLKLGMSASAKLQGKYKKTVGQLIQEFDQLDFVVMRAFAWLTLQKYHAAEFKDEEAAGEFVDDVGIKTFIAKMKELSMLLVDAPQPGGAANPQAAQTGASTTST